MNPFIVLNLPRDCTDEEVRSAYHTLLRKYPPETFPTEFQQIQEAANALKTQRDRWHQHLFFLPKNAASPLETLDDYARLPRPKLPPGLPAFKTLLRACAAAARKTAQP